MSDLSTRDRLEEAARRLDEWQSKLPGSFGPFHAQRQAALDRLRELSGSSFKLMFANKASVDELLLQATTVDQLGAGLDEVCRRASQLQSEISALEALLRSQDSGPFAASVEQRHREWLAELEPLGRDVARTAELKGPRQTLQDFQRRIPRDQIALSLLAETVELLRDLDKLGRIGLEGDLKRWREEFLRDGPSHHWTDQVRNKLETYRKNRDEHVRKIENLPGKQELGDLKKKAIPQASDWAQTLADFRTAAPPVDGEPAPSDALERIRDIDNRIQLARRSPDLTAEAADAIRVEVEELLQALAATARLRTRASLLQLRKRMELFCDACRTGAARDERIARIEQRIAALDDAPLAEPVDLQDFATELSEAKTEFEGLAANQRGTLAAAAGEAIQTLNDAVTRLLDLSHPQEVSQGVHRNRAQIPDAPGGEPQAQQSLALLEICDRISVDLARLEELSAAARQRFAKRRESALARRSEIAGVWEALGRPAPDAFEATTVRLDALARPSAGAALEHYEGQLDAIDKTLAESLTEAVGLASQELEQRRALCAESARALEAVQRLAPPAPDWPDALDGLTAPAVQELLGRSQALEAVYRRELAEAAVAVREQTQAAAEGLRAFVQGVAQSGDSKRIWAEHLLADFDDIQRLGDVDEAVQVLESARWLAGHRTFQEELRRSETRARELREQVRAMQLEIQKDSRHRYAFTLFERARRLLEGVPEEPADWEQAVMQLNEAERTLALADREAKRRIALELRETARNLKGVVQRESRPEARREVESKLDKLARQPAAATPPNDIRRELLYQALQLGVSPSRLRR
ncbi:MAG: hypothetical protein GC160_07855 [Acidobacteria bacterium]|nr:hypothetical protein [Acidobacteriota bacterium]